MGACSQASSRLNHVNCKARRVLGGCNAVNARCHQHTCLRSVHACRRTVSNSTPGRSRTCPGAAVNRPKLGFVPLEEWNKDGAHNDDPLRYLRYSLEWSAASSGKVFVKDTEPDAGLYGSSRTIILC